jgi:hypothetical protein
MPYCALMFISVISDRSDVGNWCELTLIFDRGIALEMKSVPGEGAISTIGYVYTRLCAMNG